MFLGSEIFKMQLRPIAVYVFTDGLVLFELVEPGPSTFKNGGRRYQVIDEAHRFFQPKKEMTHQEFATYSESLKDVTVRSIPMSTVKWAWRSGKGFIKEDSVEIRLNDGGSLAFSENSGRGTGQECYEIGQHLKAALGSRYFVGRRNKPS